MIGSANLIGQIGRPRAAACPVCRSPDGRCLGHGPTMTMAPVNIGDRPTLEAPMTATDNAPPKEANVPRGGTVGIKSDDDVNMQLDKEQATGPMGRFARQPVREGIEHGYRGEAEGLIEVIEPGTVESTKNATKLAAERVGERSAKVRASEPDYLAAERPKYATGDEPAKRTKADALAEAKELGVEGVTSKSKVDDIEAAIAAHKGAGATEEAQA